MPEWTPAVRQPGFLTPLWAQSSAPQLHSVEISSTVPHDLLAIERLPDVLQRFYTPKHQTQFSLVPWAPSALRVMRREYHNNTLLEAHPPVPWAQAGEVISNKKNLSTLQGLAGLEKVVARAAPIHLARQVAGRGAQGAILGSVAGYYVAWMLQLTLMPAMALTAGSAAFFGARSGWHQQKALNETSLRDEFICRVSYLAQIVLKGSSALPVLDEMHALHVDAIKLGGMFLELWELLYTTLDNEDLFKGRDSPELPA